MENKTPKTNSSYIFINTFNLDMSPEQMHYLITQGVNDPNDELCFLHDPILYCTAKKLSRMRKDFDEILFYYLLYISTIPHLNIEWYQLDSQTESAIAFFAYLINLVQLHSNKKLVTSCGIIPMCSRGDDIGYVHYYMIANSDVQKFAFIYAQDAIRMMSEIVNEFNLSPKEITAIVQLQEALVSQPRYFKPQPISAQTYHF